MPKLWTETIEAHRREVHEAIQDRTARLVVERGLHDVTMSEIAESTGIGRATLYKYYPDVHAILLAWHQRQVQTHLAELTAIGQRAADSGQALEAVLEGYALIRQQHHHAELANMLHHGAHVTHAEHALTHWVTGIIERAAKAGHVRKDVSPAELAQYSLHALTAATTLSSKAAVKRLVRVVLSGLADGVASER